MMGIKSTRGRGAGRRRGRQKRGGEPRTSIIVDLDDSNMSIDSVESSQQRKIGDVDNLPNPDKHPSVDAEDSVLSADIDDNAQPAVSDPEHVFVVPTSASEQVLHGNGLTEVKVSTTNSLDESEPNVQELEDQA